jgi:RNA polymerase sigma-70 factor (ECF subfamily)
MSDESVPSHQILYWLDQLRAGNPDARNQLVNLAYQVFRPLARFIFHKDFARLGRWTDTNEVCQEALLRLWRVLEHVTPESERDFRRLTSQAIRRVLLDLARHYYGPQGTGANHASNADGSDSNETRSTPDKEDGTFDPSRLAEWADFHQQIEALPEAEREVFELIWYHKLTQVEAASLLGVSVRAVWSRWHNACMHLARALKGEMPGG